MRRGRWVRVDQLARLAVRKADAGDDEPDDGGDHLDHRLAGLGFQRRQGDAQDAEDEAQPHQQLELLAVGGEELRPIAS